MMQMIFPSTLQDIMALGSKFWMRGCLKLPYTALQPFTFRFYTLQKINSCDA